MLQAQLAKMQKIMAGMPLDQKLGQLIVVDYVGNSYQDSGLQYMITQQFASGFIYQPANHNFDPPYDQISNDEAAIWHPSLRAYLRSFFERSILSR